MSWAICSIIGLTIGSVAGDFAIAHTSNASVPHLIAWIVVDLALGIVGVSSVLSLGRGRSK